MERSFKSLLPLLLLLALPAVVQAQFNYTDNGDGTITITEYTGSGGDVSIPGMIEGMPVNSIGDGAFYGCTGLTGVTIPDSVTSIGSWAFFACTSLTEITVDTLNSAYSSRDGVLFNKSQTTLIGYPGGKAGGYTVPSSVTSIGSDAFNSCTSLISVTIPHSVTNIESAAFAYCPGLTLATIGNGVTSIGYGAFYGCIDLTSVAIPDSVANIWGVAFADCTSLTNVTIGNGVTSIGYGAFADCTSLTSVAIGNGVTSIGDGAFYGCTSLTGVTIPDSVTNIWDRAFANCTGLTAITVDSSNPFYRSAGGVLFNKRQTTLIQCPGGKVGSYAIPNGITSIGYMAFDGCTSLTSVTIPHSATTIGDWAFNSCTSLTSVTIGSRVTTTGVGAFCGCTSLTSITIPASASSIGDGAFEFCTSLTSVRIGNGVTSIGTYAFLSCTSLTNVTIGKGVTSIGYGAFDCCPSLTSITIPQSVTSIGELAFAYCTSLTGIYFLGNAPSLLGSSVFSGDNSATAYYLPWTTGWDATYGGLPTALWNPVQRLISLVNGSPVRNPQLLTAALSAALSSIGRGNLAAAANQLRAFQNKVRSQVANPVLARQFIQAAQQVLDALGSSGPGHSGQVRLVAHPGRKGRLSFTGSVGRAHAIEASTNLVDWEVIGVATERDDGTFSQLPTTNDASPDTTFDFADPNASAFPTRFYRAVRLP